MVNGRRFERTVELDRGRVGRAGGSAEDWGASTKEIFRPESRDQTIELSENDIEEFFPLLYGTSTSDDDAWSLDVVVEPESDAPIALPLVASPASRSGSERGLLWRFLFKLGWVRFDDGTAPLGL